MNLRTLTMVLLARGASQKQIVATHMAVREALIDEQGCRLKQILIDEHNPSASLAGTLKSLQQLKDSESHVPVMQKLADQLEELNQQSAHANARQAIQDLRDAVGQSPRDIVSAKSSDKDEPISPGGHLSSEQLFDELNDLRETKAKLKNAMNQLESRQFSAPASSAKSVKETTAAGSGGSESNEIESQKPIGMQPQPLDLNVEAQKTLQNLRQAHQQVSQELDQLIGVSSPNSANKTDPSVLASDELPQISQYRSDYESKISRFSVSSFMGDYSVSKIGSHEETRHNIAADLLSSLGWKQREFDQLKTEHRQLVDQYNTALQSGHYPRNDDESDELAVQKQRIDTLEKRLTDVGSTVNEKQAQLGALASLAYNGADPRQALSAFRETCVNDLENLLKTINQKQDEQNVIPSQMGQLREDLNKLEDSRTKLTEEMVKLREQATEHHLFGKDTVNENTLKKNGYYVLESQLDAVSNDIEANEDFAQELKNRRESLGDELRSLRQQVKPMRQRRNNFRQYVGEKGSRKINHHLSERDDLLAKSKEFPDRVKNFRKQWNLDRHMDLEPAVNKVLSHGILGAKELTEEFEALKSDMSRNEESLATNFQTLQEFPFDVVKSMSQSRANPL